MSIVNFLLFSISISILIPIGCTSLISRGTSDYFKTCFHPETGGTSIPFSGPFSDPKFRPECAPDTLYSWQTEDKINWSQFPVNPLSQGIYLYTWRTPLSTYAYGNIQIRLKLKKNVKFKWIIKNRGGPLFRCPAEDQESTVYVLTTTYEKVVSEYVLCSPQVLESWSVGTKGAYYEALNEMTFIQDKSNLGPQEYDSFGFGNQRKKLLNLNRKHSSDSYFVNWDGNKLNWSNEALKRSLESLRNPNFSMAGKVFFNIGIQPDHRQHFKSGTKSYFELTKLQLNETISN